MKKNILLIIIIFIILIIFINYKKTNYYRFNDNDYIAVLVDNEPQNNFPEKGNYEISTFCNNATSKWDYDNWKLHLISIKGAAKCTISFTSTDTKAINDYIINLASNSLTSEVYNENGYRYQGKNPNNWIMFNGEYWRIIGVFDSETHGRTGENLVKIIRLESIGTLIWNKNNINNWKTSDLKILLNDYYFYGINETEVNYCYGCANSSYIQGKCNFIKNGIKSEKYRNMIENVTWKLGGVEGMAADYDVATFYTKERGTQVVSGRPISDEGRIGLMYPSDYGYSVLANDCARTTYISKYSNSACTAQNWMYGQGSDWTLTPSATYLNTIHSVELNGNISKTVSKTGNVVRPVIYLKSTVKKMAGDGSFENPYIITTES